MAAAALLVAVTPRGVITITIAALAGVGAGLVTPRSRPLSGRWSVAGLAAALTVGALALAAVDAHAALWWATVVAVVAAVSNMVVNREHRSAAPRLTVGIGVVAATWAILIMSLGGGQHADGQLVRRHRQPRPARHQPRSPSPSTTGPTTRSRSRCATSSTPTASRRTFFTVGKALDARPDISRALYDDGQLLANHSYHHDYWRWLDPRYPELGRTQDAFERNLGVCPGFYRPPHGQRTPFMSWLVHRRDMTMVTWDVSAADWSSHDGAQVAADVLKRAEPGSIILLHDGIDGTVHADRSVLLTALPLILDGLKQRGLQPVRLDQLLDKPGYVPC